LTAARRSQTASFAPIQGAHLNGLDHGDGFQVCRLSDEIADGEWLAYFEVEDSAE